MFKIIATAVVVVLLMFIGIWVLIGMPSLDSIRNTINVINITNPNNTDNSSTKDCQKYAHYDNGQKVYEYYQCVPVTPEVNN